MGLEGFFLYHPGFSTLSAIWGGDGKGIPAFASLTPPLTAPMHSRNRVCACRSFWNDAVRCSSSSSSCFLTAARLSTESVDRSTICAHTSARGRGRGGRGYFAAAEALPLLRWWRSEVGGGEGGGGVSAALGHGASLMLGFSELW